MSPGVPLLDVVRPAVRRVRPGVGRRAAHHIHHPLLDVQTNFRSTSA